MSKEERKLVWVVVGVLSSDPAVWFLSWLIPSSVNRFVGLLSASSAVMRLVHASSYLELFIAFVADMVLLLLMVAVVGLPAVIVIGKGSFRRGWRESGRLLTRMSFAKGGTGSDFAAWLIGFAVSLMLDVLPDIWHVSKQVAWAAVAFALLVMLLARLHQDRLLTVCRVIVARARHR